MTRLVLETYGDVCVLRLPGCTRIATTKDHVIPYAQGGDDSLENFRPACRACNSKRQDRAIGAGARVVVVIGPPAAGKSTYIAEHARPGDVTIDLDEIARALMPIKAAHSHVYPPHIRHIAIGARQAAIQRATRLTEPVTVWLIHAIPKPEELATYRGNRWRVVTVDPGRAVVEQRAALERPADVRPAIARWYDLTAQHSPPEQPATATSPAAGSAAPVSVAGQSRRW